MTGPILSKVALGVINTPAKTTGATGGAAASSVESLTGEIEIETKLPLIEAITAMGGPEVLLAAIDLELVVTKFPKGDSKTVSSETLFVIEAK